VTLVGTPASSGGDYPLSLTANSNAVCVANSGIQNGLRCFSYNANGLTPIAGSDRLFGLNLTNPPVSHTGPAQISFTADGLGLVVSNKGANPPLFLYSFSNNVVSTNATQSAAIGMVPFGFTFDMDGTVVLTDAAPVGTNGGLMLVGVSTGNNSLTYLLGQFFLLPNQNAACWVTRSPQTGHFYVSNAASGSVTEVSRNGNILAVVNNYALNNSKPIDSAIASVNGQDYFFQLSASQQIYPLKLGSNGTVVQLPIVSVNANHTGGIATFVPTATTSTTSQTTSQTTQGTQTSQTTTQSTGVPQTTQTQAATAVELIVSYVLLLTLFGAFV